MYLVEIFQKLLLIIKKIKIILFLQHTPTDNIPLIISSNKKNKFKLNKNKINLNKNLLFIMMLQNIR